MGKFYVVVVIMRLLSMQSMDFPCKEGRYASGRDYSPHSCKGSCNERETTLQEV